MKKPLSLIILLGIITYASTFTTNQPKFLTNDLANPSNDYYESYLAISDIPDPEVLWVQPVNGTCGCSNSNGNCTCESSSLSCNISFFDGTWGILPFGASVNYTSINSTGILQTETYLCPIDYNPPLIFPTIAILVGICLVILLLIDRSFKPAYLRDGPLIIRLYRYATTMNTFWPAVNLAITMGYLYYLLNNQTFTPYITGTSGTSQSYIVINSNWYANNPGGITPGNYTGTGILQVNGQNCIVQETSEQDYSAGSVFPSYPGIVIFLILSLVHTFHTVFDPNRKLVNYIIYCIATGVNMTTASWTWEVWDTCYALLPEYDPDLFMVYAYLGVFEVVCLVLVIVIFCCKDNWHGYVVCFGILMGLGGFVFKILTYFQLAVRYYPKLVFILDAVYHSGHLLPCLCSGKNPFK